MPIRITLLASRDNAIQSNARLRAKTVEHGGLMYARDGAKRSAAFRLCALAQDVLARVLRERNGWTPALLRTVMNQALFADIQKAPTRRTMPLIRQRLHNIALEPVVMRKRKQPRAKLQNPVVDAALTGAKRLQLPRAIVQHAHRAGKTKLTRSRRDLERIVRMPN